MKILTNNVSTIVKTVVVIFSLVGVVSCQKNKNDQPIEPVGYWKGHYTQTGFPGQSGLNVLVKADGSARVYDMGIKTDTSALSSGAKVNGTWLLSNETLDVVFTSGAEIAVLNGTINPKAKTWTGLWSRGGDVKGTISLSK